MSNGTKIETSGGPKLETLMQVLRSVLDPKLNQDVVSLGMIRDVKIGETGIVSFQVISKDPRAQESLDREIRAKVEAIPGVKELKLHFQSQSRERQASHAASIEGVKSLIAVSSGKGGVGKSTVACNLAAALALEGARVGLMDADIYGPNVPTMMGVVDGPRVEADPQRGEVLIPPTAHGIKIMSMGFLIEGDQPLVWRGPMLHNVLSQFCRQVKWGELDYLVVDMPPGTGDVQLSLAQLVPMTGTVMVSTPQEIAMQDVRKAFHMWEKVKVPIFGFVENMSYFQDDSGKKHAIFGVGGGRDLSEKFGVPLLAEVPIIQEIREAGDQGTPVVMSKPQSEAAAPFRILAKKVMQQVAQMTGASAEVEIGRFN